MYAGLSLTLTAAVVVIGNTAAYAQSNDVAQCSSSIGTSGNTNNMNSPAEGCASQRYQQANAECLAEAKVSQAPEPDPTAGTHVSVVAFMCGSMPNEMNGNKR